MEIVLAAVVAAAVAVAVVLLALLLASGLAVVSMPDGTTVASQIVAAFRSVWPPTTPGPRPPILVPPTTAASPEATPPAETATEESLPDESPTEEPDESPTEEPGESPTEGPGESPTDDDVMPTTPPHRITPTAVLPRPTVTLAPRR